MQERKSFERMKRHIFALREKRLITFSHRCTTPQKAKREYETTLLDWFIALLVFYFVIVAIQLGWRKISLLKFDVTVF